jgi:hypothetical protein
MLDQTMVHVRFDGRSWTVPAAALNVSALSGDAEVKHAVAAYLEIAPARLDLYVVERYETGNITVRPEAVFG